MAGKGIFMDWTTITQRWEKWVVPAPNYNRPHLGRGRKDQRIWSIKKRFDVTDLMLQYKEQGGRFILHSMDTSFRRYQLLDYKYRLGNFEGTKFQRKKPSISARWIKIESKSNAYGTVPYPMFVLGELDSVEQSLSNLDCATTKT